MQLPIVEQKTQIGMISTLNDTICAVSTPAGVGGIAVVRISGPEALEIAGKIWHARPIADMPSHTAMLGSIADSDGELLDQAVATVYRAPHSFTGDDVVEISTHGSAYVQQEAIASLIKAGARLAEPGEFTRRAFANGKIDLAQAEAVADIIAAESKAANRIAQSHMRGQFSSRLSMLRNQLLELASLLELELDFAEEDVEFASRAKLMSTALEIKEEVDRLADSFHAGSAIKQGIPVAIIGPTNAGKSSLLNALLGDDRAIVSDIHGTTRDIVEDRLTISGFTFRIMDTAGLRRTTDKIESLGIERTLQAAAGADIIIAVADSASPGEISIPASQAQAIIVLNKSDLAPDAQIAIPDGQTRIVRASAKLRVGIDEIKRHMAEIAASTMPSAANAMVTSQRHYQALLQASQSITRAIEAMQASLSGDLIAQDIRLTINHLSSILGQITSSEILHSVFSRFCIGK